jgi:glycerate kinase
MAYFKAQIKSGVDLLLDYADFNTYLAKATLVITGEGKLDSQSLSGKGPIGVAKRAQAQGTSVIALVGTVDADTGALQAAGIDVAWPIVDRIMSLDEALRSGASLLERAAFRLGCTLAISL